MKKDEEWITGVTPEEGEFKRRRIGPWQATLLTMKVGEWAKTPNINPRQMTSGQNAASKLKKAGMGVWKAKTSADGKWRWIQRVK